MAAILSIFELLTIGKNQNVEKMTIYKVHFVENF